MGQTMAEDSFVMKLKFDPTRYVTIADSNAASVPGWHATKPNLWDKMLYKE
jgi:hypothetical protein